MKITNKKTITITAISLFLVVAAVATVFYLHKNTPQVEVPVDSNTQVNKSESSPDVGNEKSDAQRKKDYLDSQKGKSEDNQNSNPGTPTKVVVSASASLTDSQLVITTSVTGVTAGKCSLVLTNTKDTIKQTADIAYAPGGSYCEGFAVDKASLSKGQWTATITVEDGKASGSKTLKVDVI